MRMTPSSDDRSRPSWRFRRSLPRRRAVSSRTRGSGASKAAGFTLADSGTRLRPGADRRRRLADHAHARRLYVSGGQAFFNQQTFTLRDPTAPVDSGFRVVDLKNLRKLDVALMGFPGEHLRFHPYVGAGFTLSQIGDRRSPRARSRPSSSSTYARRGDPGTSASRSRRCSSAVASIACTRFSVFGQVTREPDPEELPAVQRPAVQLQLRVRTSVQRRLVDRSQ